MTEAYACGTLYINYNNTAQLEIVSDKLVRVVKTSDIVSLTHAYKEIVKNNFYSVHSFDCRKRAKEYFDKDKCFEKKINLYKQLISQ